MMGDTRDPGQVAFELFADIYPHEAYAAFPERLLEYAMRITGQPRDIILSLLRETETERQPSEVTSC